MAFRLWFRGRLVSTIAIEHFSQLTWDFVDFNNPSGSRLGLFTAIQNIGGICALLFSSYAADLFGRRKGVCLGLLIVFLGTILQGRSLNKQALKRRY